MAGRGIILRGSNRKKWGNYCGSLWMGLTAATRDTSGRASGDADNRGAESRIGLWKFSESVKHLLDGSLKSMNHRAEFRTTDVQFASARTMAALDRSRRGARAYGNLWEVITPAARLLALANQSCNQGGQGRCREVSRTARLELMASILRIAIWLGVLCQISENICGGE